jgi:hypothetical protein
VHVKRRSLTNNIRYVANERTACIDGFSLEQTAKCFACVEPFMGSDFRLKQNLVDELPRQT